MRLSRNSRDASAFWKSESETSNTNSEDSKPPDILIGFKKIPVVVLKRYNIDRYLRTNKNDIAYKRFKLRECSVRVQRLNLELATISVSNQSEDTPYLKCNVCEKIYYNEKKLENHKQIKHELCMVQVKTPKKVTFCDQVTVFEPQLYHRCRKCPSIFKNYTDLKSHTKHKHKKRKCYICHFCDKQFVDRMFFKVHIKLHCLTCGMLFDYKHECVAHRKLCMPPVATQQKCNYCSQIFSSNCILKYHIAVVHRKCTFAYNELYASKLRTDSVEFICLFCKHVSSSWLQFQSHINTLYNSDKKILHECSICKSEFIKEEKLIEHKKSHRVVTTEGSLHSCKEDIEQNKSHRVVTTEAPLSPCKEEIKQKKSHRVIITEGPCHHWLFYGSKYNKTVPCHLNPIVLVRRTMNLEKYFDKLYRPKKKRVKLEKSDHQCNVCKKFFTSAYCVRRHMSCVHFDYENNICRDCNVGFDWPSQLLNHDCPRRKSGTKKTLKNNAVVDLTEDIDVDIEGVNDNEDEYESMLIPPPIVELTVYDHEYKFDNNQALMPFDNGSELDNHSYDNNAVMSFDNGFRLNNHSFESNTEMPFDNGFKLNNHSFDSNAVMTFDNGIKLNNHSFDSNAVMSVDNGSKLNNHTFDNNEAVMPFDNGFTLNDQNLDNNAVMSFDNGLKFNVNNQFNNNNRVQNKIIRMTNDGKLVVSPLQQCANYPQFMVPVMASYKINNNFMADASQPGFNLLQQALCKGIQPLVMPPLIPFADKDAASTNINGN